MSVRAKITQTSFKLEQLWTSRERWLNRHVNLPQPYLPPKRLNRKFIVKNEPINGFPCMVFQCKKNATNKRIIYIHGGAWVFAISHFQYDFIARVAKATGATVFVPIYPYSTSTRSSNSDIIKMITDLYKKILLNNDHCNITIMGDSAGGNIALVSAQQIKLMNLPPPKNVIALSPPVDLVFSELEFDKQMKIEPVLPKCLIPLAFAWYIRNDDPHKSIYSPIYGDCKDIGLITIFFGEHESLLASARVFSEKLNDQHINHNFYVTPKMFHVYTIFRIKEAKSDFLKIVDLIKN